MGRVYTCFWDVYRDARAGVFSNEAELKQAFVEALKNELGSRCARYIVEAWLKPALEEAVREGRADIVVSNIVIEVEPPGKGLSRGLGQLERYMEGLYQRAGGAVEVLGLVTDGVEAVLLRYRGSGYDQLGSGEMPRVAGLLVERFCASKIPVIDARDLVRLFGVGGA